MPAESVDLPAVLGIVVPIGGAFLTAIVAIVAGNWRKAKVSEHRAVVVQNMLDKGFSPGEIERVLAAGEIGGDRFRGRFRRRYDTARA